MSKVNGRTDDGRLVVAKAHMTLRVRSANKTSVWTVWLQKHKYYYVYTCGNVRNVFFHTSAIQQTLHNLFTYKYYFQNFSQISKRKITG